VTGSVHHKQGGRAIFVHGSFLALLMIRNSKRIGERLRSKDRGSIHVDRAVSNSVGGVPGASEPVSFDAWIWPAGEFARHEGQPARHVPQWK
jgi:hypothetical protein